MIKVSIQAVLVSFINHIIYQWLVLLSVKQILFHRLGGGGGGWPPVAPPGSDTDPTNGKMFEELCLTADDKLFKKIQANNNHVLNQFLPEKKTGQLQSS